MKNENSISGVVKPFPTNGTGTRVIQLLYQNGLITRLVSLSSISQQQQRTRAKRRLITEPGFLVAAVAYYFRIIANTPSSPGVWRVLELARALLTALNRKSKVDIDYISLSGESGDLLTT
ncbi:hypothetical protein GQX74_005774 [Glossina fuscipes]|nr:hypothetical protein GQX74_005774 [Glossina fuscipes]